MCGRGPVRLVVGALLAALAWMSSCTYSPSPESGSLLCGAGSSCPKGYNCADGRTCWKDGQIPPDGGAADVKKDLGARPDAPARLVPFVGTWNFESGVVSTMCSDGSKDMRDLAGDFVDISLGTDSDLIASFYCDWKVNIVGGGTVLARPGQTCTTTSAGTQFTWTVMSFGFATGDGQNASLVSKINAAYNNGGSVGTCMLTIGGAPGAPVQQAILVRAP